MKEGKEDNPTSVNFTWGWVNKILDKARVLAFWVSLTSKEVIKRIIQWCGFISPCKWILGGSGLGLTNLWRECSWQQACCWNTWADASEYCFRKDQRFSISLFFLSWEACGQKLQETQINSFNGLSRKRVRVWGAQHKESFACNAS